MSTDTGESTQSTESLAAAGNGAYQITVNLNQQTVQALKSGGFSLYGLKAVQPQGQSGGSAPLIWLRTNNYLMSTPISWSQQYQAYVSNSQIIRNGQITVISSMYINLGQTLEIQNGGRTMVTGQGRPGVISILNQDFSQFTVGLAQPVDGPPAPYCAFPLYGNMMTALAPVEKVLLMFSPTQMNPGTVALQAASAGVLVDLTSTNQKTVSFDINNGWSGGTQIPAGSELAPLLIQG